MADLGMPPMQTSIGNVEKQIETISAWKARARERGLDENQFHYPLMINCIIGDTDEDAVRQAQQYIPPFMQAQVDHYEADKDHYTYLKTYKAWQNVFKSMKGLDDQGRPVQPVAGPQVFAPVAGHLAAFAEPPEIERAGAVRLGRAGLRAGRDRPRRGGLGGDHHRPVHRLDPHAGDDAVEQPGILAFVIAAKCLQGGRIEGPLGQGDLDLVALAPVAQEADPPDRERLARRARRDDVPGLPLHLGKQGVDAVEVETVEEGVVAAHDLVGHRRAQEPDGGADTRVRRHDDARDPGLLGDPGGVKGAVAAEGDHGALGQILAPLDGMDPRGVRHVLVDDLRDAVGAGASGPGPTYTWSARSTESPSLV